MSPMRDGRTNERTREDRATQPMDAGGCVSQIHVAIEIQEIQVGIEIQAEEWLLLIFCSCYWGYSLFTVFGWLVGNKQDMWQKPECLSA